MKKPLKVFLGVLAVLCVLGICFACISVYAKKEMNKPKFEFPEELTDEPKTELPESKTEAFEYVNSLYGAVLAADNVEATSSVRIRFEENCKLSSPLSSADETVLSRILSGAQDAIGDMYPENENVPVSKAQGLPALGFESGDVIDFTARKGYTDDTGEFVDDGYYYIMLEVNPESIDTDALVNGEIRTKVENGLADAVKLSSIDIDPEAFEISFKIAYYNDSLESVEIKQDFNLNASVDFLNDYASVSDETLQLSIPYTKVTDVDFMHYGIHFTERQIVVKKGDIEAVPLEVRVNSEAVSDDFTLSFETSKQGILDIDPDGVINVLDVSDQPVIVTAVFEYKGRSYTDTLIVYATQLEVRTDD